MSTWHSVTVQRHDGQPVDLEAVRDALTAHGFDGHDYADDPLDHPVTGERDADGGYAVDRSTAHVGWWSKYTEGDAGALAASLGVGWTVTHAEEWDDEGPGASEAVYVDGELDNGASNSLRPVSDQLAHLNLTDPETVAAVLAALPSAGAQ